jgi:hypothetical protein
MLNQKIKSFKIEGVEIPLTILKDEVIDCLLAGNNLICNYSVEFEPEKPKSNVLFEIVKPELDQKYWYIGNNGNVYHEAWGRRPYSGELNRFNLNNCFLTRENAQKQADRNKLLADIERFAAENNEVIDWNDGNKAKWYIGYNKSENEWQLPNTYMYQIVCQEVYFSSEAIATEALEKFKDRLDILLD